MICRKCGSVLKEGMKYCPFCEEPITAGGEKTEKLVTLRELAEVPSDKEQLLAELKRLRDYFLQNRGKYGVMEDLWLMQLKWQAPSLLHWTAGGCLATIAAYMVLYGAGLIPHVAWAFFFILWGAITCGGYIRSGRAYEARKTRLEDDLRNVENEVRTYYNQADNCFLPFDYSHPQVISELIQGLENGTIQSFKDYRIG